MEVINIEHNGISLETRVAGPENGEVVILLHGFPECWATWKHQIPVLAEAGYRVYVPNQRGYGHSSKPKAVSAYHVDRLIEDVDAIRKFSGAEKIHLVGHDWGAIIAWWYAIHMGDNINSLSVLNVPHPEVFLNSLKANPLQVLKSWYMFFFQIPWLPEKMISLFNYMTFRKVLTLTSNKGSYQPEDIKTLLEHWRIPGAMTGMVNYYRSVIRTMPHPKGDGQVHCPTQILWGEQDLALTLPMASKSLDYTSRARLFTYPDATHWLAHDKPEEVNSRLIEFFTTHKAVN